MVLSTCQNSGVNFENLGGRFAEVARNGDPPAWGLLFWTPVWELTVMMIWGFLSSESGFFSRDGLSRKKPTLPRLRVSYEFLKKFRKLIVFGKSSKSYLKDKKFKTSYIQFYNTKRILFNDITKIRINLNTKNAIVLYSIP